MIDYSRAELEDGRPTRTAAECLDFCLDCIYEDTTHKLSDQVTDRLTFEELIGALLAARDITRRAEA